MSERDNSTTPPSSQLMGSEIEKAITLGAAVLTRIEDPSVREIAIRNALTQAVKGLSAVPQGAVPVRASEQAQIDAYKAASPPPSQVSVGLTREQQIVSMSKVLDECRWFNAPDTGMEVKSLVWATRLWEAAQPAPAELLMGGDLAQAGRDIRILLAQIDWLEELTGEKIEGEDAVLVAQIRQSWATANQMPNSAGSQIPDSAEVRHGARVDDRTLPGGAGSAIDIAKAKQFFTDYFVKNYPGPDTIIFDPKWHAPRLFEVAMRCVRSATATEGSGE